MQGETPHKQDIPQNIPTIHTCVLLATIQPPAVFTTLVAHCARRIGTLARGTGDGDVVRGGALREWLGRILARVARQTKLADQADGGLCAARAGSAGYGLGGSVQLTWLCYRLAV